MNWSNVQCFVMFCTIWIYFICLSRPMSLMVTGCFNFFPIRSAVPHYSFQSQQPSQQIMFCEYTRMQDRREHTVGKSLYGSMVASDAQELFSIRGNVVSAQVTALILEFPQTILSVAQSIYIPKLKSWMHEIYSDIRYRVWNSAFILPQFQQVIKRPPPYLP